MFFFIVPFPAKRVTQVQDCFFVILAVHKHILTNKVNAVLMSCQLNVISEHSKPVKRAEGMTPPAWVRTCARVCTCLFVLVRMCMCIHVCSDVRLGLMTCVVVVVRNKPELDLQLIYQSVKHQSIAMLLDDLSPCHAA